MSRKKTVRKPVVAAFAALCGVVVAVGGPVTWISAHGKRPETWMAHTLFSKMLVYTFVGSAPFWKSASLEVLILGILMVVGALIGRRLLVIVAAIVALAVEIMWMGLVAHRYNTPNAPNIRELNPANLPWADLRAGAWMVLVGAIAGILSTFWLRHKRVS